MRPPAPPPGSGATVRFVTFGCKVNQYDTQVLREAALAAGWRESGSPADLVVVNTCSVTAHGGALARKAVRRLARENPAARILVTGCWAASDPEEAAALPGVGEVIDNDGKAGLLSLLGGNPDGPFIERRVAALEGHTRAFLKVQDGCPIRCSYCLVPHVRPAVTSKRPDTVVAEVRDLVAAGHREVVLTGVHLGAFGADPGKGREGDGLAGLVRRILRETDLPRLRLSSIEASEADDALVSAWDGEPRLAPHFHLPLQSGSPAVLSRMRRRYGPDGFLAAVDRLRARVRGVSVTTDVIVGFPGETTSDFEATLSVMRRSGFMKTHVFPFSARPGTPAADLPGRVPSREIRRRVAEADRLGRELARAAAAAARGSDALALIETRRSGSRLTGFTGRYFRVFLDGPDDLTGRLVPVRLGEPEPGGIRAERREG